MLTGQQSGPGLVKWLHFHQLKNEPPQSGNGPGTENYSLEAPMMADGRITVEIALEALGRLEVDSVGLDEVDHKLL